MWKCSGGFSNESNVYVCMCLSECPPLPPQGPGRGGGAVEEESSGNSNFNRVHFDHGCMRWQSDCNLPQLSRQHLNLMSQPALWKTWAEGASVVCEGIGCPLKGIGW